MRLINSDYDERHATLTGQALEALRRRGHEVECTATGDVIVDGEVITAREWTGYALDVLFEEEA